MLHESLRNWSCGNVYKSSDNSSPSRELDLNSTIVRARHQINCVGRRPKRLLVLRLRNNKCSYEVADYRADGSKEPHVPKIEADHLAHRITCHTLPFY